jgi:hypothetical protein
MSTFGTALVVDTPPGVPFDPPDPVRSALVDGFGTTAPDGWDRAVALVSEVEVVDDLLDALLLAGTGRLAVAEDNNGYGVRWVVAHAVDGEVETVHRRYLLAADPADAAATAGAVDRVGEDPRVHDLAGPEAAAAAARVFGVDPAPVVAAEAESAQAWRRMGTPGGPFPWWPALGLPFPRTAAGAPLTW